MVLMVSPKRTRLVLTLVAVGLTLASISGQFSKHLLGHGHLFGLVRLFNLDDEGNIPTWYASSLLLLCSILLVTIACTKKREGDRYLLHWKALALIFLMLSLDETAQIHESPNRALRVALNSGGVLYNPWVIFGSAFVLLLVVAYWRFLSDLPSPTRRLFLTAGFLYVGGALGVEIVSGWYMALYGRENMTYAMIATVEELLEMLGTVTFIYALMSYMSSHLGDVRVRMADEGPSLPP